MDYKQLSNKPIIVFSKFLQIDFGTAMINEKSFTITDTSCTVNSKISVQNYFTSQTEPNHGINLELFVECFNGSFNVIAIGQTEPLINGIFNLKYTIE